jgi:hypothetical protein
VIKTYIAAGAIVIAGAVGGYLTLPKADAAPEPVAAAAAAAPKPASSADCQTRIAALNALYKEADDEQVELGLHRMQGAMGGDEEEVRIAKKTNAKVKMLTRKAADDYLAASEAGCLFVPKPSYKMAESMNSSLPPEIVAKMKTIN